MPFTIRITLKWFEKIWSIFQNSIQVGQKLIFWELGKSDKNW